MAIISDDVRAIATKRFQDLGFRVTFGAHIEEINEFTTSSIESRLEDLHAAYRDPSVKAVFAVIGGFASNQLLPYIDWELIRQNPKPLIGYSDTTALQNAFFAKAGVVSYSGPAYSTFGQKLHFDYTLEFFKKCVMDKEPFDLTESKEWTDDLWFIDQNDRHPISNEGWSVHGTGEAEGILLAGNLNTFHLLQGTEYFPSLEGSILFLEEDDTVNAVIFDRQLESLAQTEAFRGVKGMVIGRFQKKSEMTKEKLETILKNKKGLDRLPIITDVDFGHTSPLCTFPIGGRVRISVNDSRITIF
jgi:muramoyltetrapeptide carboxypeptidase